MKCCDFDGVGYLVTCDPKEDPKIYVSIALLCFEELAGYGAKEYAASHYKDMVVEPREGYDYTIAVDLTKLPESEEERKKLADSCGLLKRHLMAGAFQRAIDMFKRQELGETLVLPYRDDEAMYLRPQDSSCAVVFSLRFDNEDDVAFARVFMQEFADARRDVSLRSAPAVTFKYGQKPLELDSVTIAQEKGVGFITFALFDRHVNTEEAANRSIDLVHQFRTYLHYHMKCSTAYLHSRMRKKYADFLQILNQAKPGAGEMRGPGTRTATGRFMREART